MGEYFMNKLIVTCGTSQLEKKVIENLAQPVLDSFINLGVDHQLENELRFFPERIDFNEPDPNLIDPSIDRWINVAVDTFGRIYGGQLETLGELIGTPENPLGAELTTLHKIKERPSGVQWNPAEDQIILISSNTCRGLSAAIYIARLLTAIYGVPTEKIKIDMVLGLDENPVNVEIALCNFATLLLDHMDVEQKQDRCENYMLVMSGGFKSVIPCMSFVSFLFGIELIYIFEASDKLQSLNPSINLQDDKDRKFWKKVWEDLEKRGFVNQASCFHVVLSQRLSHPNLVF
jgi:putative CRISPR-associated protein (TIGR02619 family)